MQGGGHVQFESKVSHVYSRRPAALGCRQRPQPAGWYGAGEGGGSGVGLGTGESPLSGCRGSPRTICVSWNPGEGGRGTLEVREEGWGAARNQSCEPREWAELGLGETAG